MSELEPLEEQYIRQIVQEEIKHSSPHLAVVTKTFPHTEAGDDSNYEVGLELVGAFREDVIRGLERVPVAVTMGGATRGLEKGDLVLVEYIRGDTGEPVVTHAVYGDSEERRAPLTKESEFRRRIADEAVVEVVTKDDDTRQINIGHQPEDRGDMGVSLQMNMDDGSFCLMDGSDHGLAYDGEGNAVMNWESMAMPWGAAGPVPWDEDFANWITENNLIVNVEDSEGLPVPDTSVTVEAEEITGGSGGSGGSGGGSGTPDVEDEAQRSAAVQQGWGEPVESMSIDFRNGDLEGKFVPWGDGDGGCAPVDTWNGLRCEQNSTVRDGMHVIEGTPDGRTSGATSHVDNTFQYGRIEYRERAYCADNCDRPGYNVTPIIYPIDPEDPAAGNGEIDIAERRIGEQDPFFVAHWNGDNYHFFVDIDGTKWHNYAVEWLPNSVSWYIDGQLVGTHDVSIDIEAEYNAGQMDMFQEDGTEMQHAFYEIDWVKFYEYDADGPSPPPENDHHGGTDWEPTNVEKGID